MPTPETSTWLCSKNRHDSLVPVTALAPQDCAFCDSIAFFKPDTSIRGKFQRSLREHQIGCAGTSWFSLPVTLTGSDNEYLQYPCDGVIRFAEQGTDLHASNTVFHRQNQDGSLGAPVTVRNAKFEYRGRPGAALRPTLPAVHTDSGFAQ